MKDSHLMPTETPSSTTQSRNIALALSVEQWELLRRLRNSHLTKTQIIQAYDELDRLDRELGQVFNQQIEHQPLQSHSHNQSSQKRSPTILNVHKPNDVIIQLPNDENHDIITTNNDYSTTKDVQLSPSSQPLSTNKRSHNSIHNGLLSSSSKTSSTSSSAQQQQQQQQNGNSNRTLTTPSQSQILTTSSTGNPLGLLSQHRGNYNGGVYSRNVTSSNSSTCNGTNGEIINENVNIQSPHIALPDLEDEARELQELLSKGDVAIHNEISVFVYRYDLKQSQIARMADIKQLETLHRFTHDVSHIGTQNVADIVNTVVCEPSAKVIKLDTNSSLMSFEAPKRTRFTFRPEHLDILEKAFIDNPYPDPRRREELARVCNEARSKAEGTEVLNERERVTEQIVTHWFQNKRKMTKRANQDEHLPITNTEGSSLTSVNDCGTLEYDNNSNEDEHDSPNSLSPSNINNNSSGTNTANKSKLDVSLSETNNDECLDPTQLAAYRAIMSRMSFLDPIKTTSSSSYIKQEPYENPNSSATSRDSKSPTSDDQLTSSP
ncbi:unnamed protein product [Didymodactylos carnosus]|uniref:Homeobox domain-containing protein n=1 Tax=Didymodactylos carnosus TaxID=1234261 RepID=A0A8S2CXF3_9BILA|nr:unnamed protein product [Didymodactylos carnosus]CAF3536075.1 unnamed protein product [Didymodactylos carnosus]